MSTTMTTTRDTNPARLLPSARIALGGLLLGILGQGCVVEEGRSIDALDRGDAPADAASAGASFDPHRILTDAAMLDADAFSAAEIDAFLADPYEDGLASCLDAETFGGKSAGQLIHATALRHGINPLFLLAHLQKESSLVGEIGTCAQIAMDEAFGCGCPDGSGCAPEFSGFENQLECAGDLTRSYLDDLDAGQPTISGWAVGKPKSTLDPQTITPQNKATAVLYTYTPWVGDRSAGGNPAPFGNYLFWQVWSQYVDTLGYAGPSDGDGDVPPPPLPPAGDDDDHDDDDGDRGALADWSYILDRDFGLRSDGLGEGYFQAPRSGAGLHNGLDILGEVGEPLYTPCSGEVLSGVSGSFGNWVQLVCPVELSDRTVYASLFYAHLDRREVGFGNWQPVAKDIRVGRLGSTGNASGTNPHVHVELIFHASRSEALGELHNGADKSSNATSDVMVSILQQECLEPNGFNSANPADIIRLGRRFDPFLAMTCLGADKAAMQTPSAAMQSRPVPWSDWYTAATFDVNSEHL